MCMGPTQKRCEIGQCCRKYSLFVPEEREVDIRISFAEFLSIVVDEERDMAETGRRPVEGFVQGDMHRCGRHPFLLRSATIG